MQFPDNIHSDEHPRVFNVEEEHNENYVLVKVHSHDADQNAVEAFKQKIQIKTKAKITSNKRINLPYSL